MSVPDLDAIADELRLAHLKRVGGDQAFYTALRWDQLQPSERQRWRQEAGTTPAGEAQ